MTKTHKTAKITAVALTLAILAGMFCMFGTASANAATARVSLYNSGVTFAKYGMTTSEIFVKTNDNANDQLVTVHYNYLDNFAWKDAKAEYVTTLDDGAKLWKAVITSYNTRYAIKYVADGETFWDNNNGKDYTTADVLGTAPVTVQRLGYQYGNTYQIDAVLQNYAYNKSVVVRYTTDGWKTYKDQNLGYKNTNDNGTETWTTTLNIDNTEIGQFEYAVRYNVYGTEYWANNLGDNYDVMYCIHH